MSEPRLIAIHTPTRDGKCHRAHFDAVQGLLDRAKDGTSRGFGFLRRFDEGSPNIPRQRNWGVAQALRHGCEGVLFVDSDIAFDPEDALRIFERPEEVIGVSHQTRARLWSHPPNMSGRFDDDGAKSPTFDAAFDLLKVFQPTTGFLYVKTTVFRAMIEAGLVRQFIAPNVPAETWPFLYDFFVHQVNELHVTDRLARTLEKAGMPSDRAFALDGEDWDFARKCDKLGVQMWLEPLASLVHYEGISGMDCNLHLYWTVYDRRHLQSYRNWVMARAGRGCAAARVKLAELDAQLEAERGGGRVRATA